MESVLLICPHFMGYDIQIVEELKKNYEVDFLDNEIFLKNVRQKYFKLPKIIKILFKLAPGIKYLYRENMLLNCNSKYIFDIDFTKEYKYIVVINGDGFSDDFYNKLFKKQYKAMKILYIWDDYSWLFKNSHVKYFDKVFSFNIIDCKSKKFNYLPMYTKKYFCAVNEKKYDIAIVASANKKRVNLAKYLYNKYKDQYNFYIYFYSKKNWGFFDYKQPLSNDEYLEVLSKSKAIVDCYRGNQKGPTTRVYDSLMTKTKIITTNKEIKNYPVYNKNILILNKKNEIPNEFIYDKYFESSIKEVTIDLWISHLLLKNDDYYKKEEK